MWTSTLNRTIITAVGLPFPKVQWKVLDEIQVGATGRDGVQLSVMGCNWVRSSEPIIWEAARAVD